MRILKEGRNACHTALEKRMQGLGEMRLAEAYHRAEASNMREQVQENSDGNMLLGDSRRGISTVSRFGRAGGASEGSKPLPLRGSDDGAGSRVEEALLPVVEGIRDVLNRALSLAGGDAGFK